MIASGPRRHLSDSQGLHDGRPAQRADRAAGEDRAGQLCLLGPQEPPEPPHIDGDQGGPHPRHGLHY